MMDEGEPSTSNPEQQLPNGSKRNRNGSNVDPLDCMLLPELPPKKEEGIWRLKIEYLSIEESDAYRVCLIWMNVAKNQAIIPDADVITDPAAREREQLREGLIPNPFVEETERTKREKESWSPEEEKQLCSALKRNKQDFSEAAKLVPNKTQAECVAYWHHYENLRLKRKRERKLSEEAASPPKKSRSGRTIKTPRRFSEGAKERRRLKRNKKDFPKAAKSVRNKTQNLCMTRKRKRKLRKEQEDAKEAASSPKKSRTGRTIKTPRRYSKGAEERRGRRIKPCSRG